MKKYFLLFLLCFITAQLSAFNPLVPVQTQIHFVVNYEEPVVGGNPFPKSDPIQPPYVTQNDNVLTFDANHADYVLTLLDEDGEEVYTTVVPSILTTVVLPSTLTGVYELQLYPGGDYVFVGEIVL